MDNTKETVTSRAIEKIDAFHKNETRKVDMISTLGIAVSFFCLGIMTQHFVHTTKWNKAIAEVDKMLKEAKESTEATEESSDVQTE